MKCYHCGTEFQNGMTRCPGCGAPVGGNPHASSAYPAYDRTPSSGYANEDYYPNHPPMPPKRNNAVKWTVIIFSILTVLVVLGTVLFVVFRLNSGMSQKKAYQKYVRIIEQHRDDIAEYEDKNDSNSIALVDINDSGIPDVLYITQDENNTPYLHCVTDNKTDVEEDAQDDICGELDSEYTMFKTGDNAIYIRTKDSLFRLTKGKNESGKSRLQKETLAQRTYDESQDEYTYVILDSDVFKEVSEKEYNDYIDSVCNQKITVILTTLSDDDLNKLFTDVSEDISEKQDETIKRLKEDIVPVGDSSTPDSAASQSQEAKEEKAEEKDRNFVHDHYLVEYDDVVFYVDDDGLWKKEPDSESEKLVSCSATNLATDGQVIYYGVFNKTVTYNYYSTTIKNYQYDMYKYDLSTGSNEKLMSFVEAGRPICAVGDTVYYTDYPDDFDGNKAGLAQGICSYNTATGEKKYLCDGAHLTAFYGDKIFYREIMAAGGGMGVHQIHCFDIKTQSSKDVSEDNVMNLKVIGDKLYYTINTDFASGVMNSVHYKLCRYDIATEETTVLSELTNIKDFDDKYAIGANKQDIERSDLASGKTEHIPLPGYGGKYSSAIRDKNTTYAMAVNDTKYTIYAIDDDATSANNIGSVYAQSVLAVKDQTAFYINPSDKNFYFYHIDHQKLD